MHIALLGCDNVPQRFRYIAGGYRDMFQALLAPHVPHLNLDWIDLYHGDATRTVHIRCDRLHRLTLLGGTRTSIGFTG